MFKTTFENVYKSEIGKIFGTSYYKYAIVVNSLLLGLFMLILTLFV